MYSVVSAIVVLGVLIFVHELGHFVVAKLSGVRVLVFSLGFGPKLCGVRLGETEYILSAIPLGGYVKMLGEGKGEEEDEEAELSEEEQQGSYAHKGPWRRMAIIIAGPLTNILFAALVFAVVYLFGVPSLVPVVGEVNYEMPAYSAGFRTGDRIISIDGKKIETWDELSSTIRSSGGRELKITYERKGEIHTTRVVPKKIESEDLFGESEVSYVIGITASGKKRINHYQPGEALIQGIRETWNVTRLTIINIVKIFRGAISPKELGGPIMIAQIAGQAAKSGALTLLYFIGVISVNLGIFNLIPIPILDGGHLLFIFVELIMGRPLNSQQQKIAFLFGFFLLVSLMIFVSYNDLTRFFSQ